MKKILLVLIDAVLFYAALFATLSLRYGGNLSRELVDLHIAPMTIILIVWLIIFYIHNLYSLSYAKNSVSFINTLFRALAIGAIFGILYFYLSPQTQITPKTNFLIHVALYSIFLLAWRSLANRTFARWTKERIGFIGGSDAMRRLANAVLETPQLGYEAAVALPLDVAATSALHEFIQERNVGTVVVDDEGYNDPNVVRNLFSLIPQGIAVERLPSFYETFVQRIPLDTIDHLWFLEHITEHRQRSYESAKRIADILLSFVAGAFFLALFPILALLIKTSSSGPIFYRQTRVGKNLKQFEMLKFRTMRSDAEKQGAQWAQKEDPRITGVGKFFRATHLDELPQCWNMLKGDMSAIGPRAERPEFHVQLKDTIPFYEERYLVRPGVTGWAQINHPYGASEEDAKNKLEYDLYYIKNRSVALDFSIVLKTIDLMLTGRGSR